MTLRLLICSRTRKKKIKRENWSSQLTADVWFETNLCRNLPWTGKRRIDPMLAPLWRRCGAMFFLILRLQFASFFFLPYIPACILSLTIILSKYLKMIWCKPHTGEGESERWRQLNLTSAATIGYPSSPFRKGKYFVDSGWIEGKKFRKNLLLPKSYSSAGHKAR